MRHGAGGAGAAASVYSESTTAHGSASQHWTAFEFQLYCSFKIISSV
jgi:hypothetical protein